MDLDITTTQLLGLWEGLEGTVPAEAYCAPSLSGVLGEN